MNHSYEASIDPIATGLNIKRLRLAHGRSIKDIQEFFGFLAPQAVYKWERGTSLPSLDNIFSLAKYYSVRIDDIIVELCTQPSPKKIVVIEQSESHGCSNSFRCSAKDAA